VEEEADAIVLYDIADFEVTKRSSVELKARIAYKILKRDGEHFGTAIISTNPSRKVKGLKGWLVKPNGECQSLSKEDITIVGIAGSAGYYDDSQMMVAALADVKPGVVAAFEYTVIEKGWTSLYQAFSFQVQQPVQYARFSIQLPENWQLHKAEQRTDEVVHFSRRGNSYTWIASNLKLQPEEPLSPPWSYLSRRVAVACFDPEGKDTRHFPDWGTVAKWCSKTLSPPATVTHDLAEEAARITQDLSSFEDKLKAIAVFCQEEVRYVAVEIGKGRWIPRSASTTLLNRYGDCKDKVMLMRTMLQSIDITSIPVLASTSYPVRPQLVTPFQFDHCIIAVPLNETGSSVESQSAIVDRWLFFDPTDPITEIGALPSRLQGRRVLLGTIQDSILLRLPYPSPQDNRRVYLVNANLKEDGVLTGNIRISEIGSWASQTRYERRTQPPAA
jgi:transglutaminase-like putative cysteine protease